MQCNSDAADDDGLSRAIAAEIARAKSATSTSRIRQSRSRSRESGADLSDDTEYHLARLLILINEVAGKGFFRGLTKLAKLDFLLRYPTFLERLADSGAVSALKLSDLSVPTENERGAVESRMIRYKYGPWDNRYYALIGALVGRGLAVYGDSTKLSLRLTDGGRAIAATLAVDPAWERTTERSRVLRVAFGRTSGNRLKELIYTQLPDAVDRPHRTEI